MTPLISSNESFTVLKSILNQEGKENRPTWFLPSLKKTLTRNSKVYRLLIPLSKIDIPLKANETEPHQYCHHTSICPYRENDSRLKNLPYSAI